MKSAGSIIQSAGRGQLTQLNLITCLATGDKICPQKMGGRRADKSAHVYPHTYLEIKNLLCHQSPRISSLPLLLPLNSKKLNVNNHITISWLKNDSLSALVKNVLICCFFTAYISSDRFLFDFLYSRPLINTFLPHKALSKLPHCGVSRESTAP